MHNNYLYILIMAFTTFLIRVLPLTAIRKQITNTFLRSFLYYVPYVTLSVMTFPAILDATQTPVAGAAALVGGVVAAWCKVSMFLVALICCVIVFLTELIFI